MQQYEGDWRRLDARMLLIHPVREVGRLLPALIGAGFAGRNFGGGGHELLWPLIGFVMVVAFAVTRWFTTTYRFTSQQVQLRTGLFQRNTFVASTDRVRTVEVTASPLHRVLGLAAVEIGTGAGDKPVQLDGLPKSEADALRSDLLHRKGAQVPEREVDGGPEAVDSGQPDWVAPMDHDEVLYRLRRKWMLYAPLGVTGFATAGVLIGFSFQLMDQLGVFDSESDLGGEWAWLQDASVAVIILLLTAGLLVTVSLLSIAGFAISYFGFVLSRDRDGRTLHVRRGLLTTRSTSLEVRRLRGVEMRRPIPLRWAGGARLAAVMTGLERHDGQSEQGSVLAPASPKAVITDLADSVLCNSALRQPLSPHGPAATRRRYLRAIVPFTLIAAAVLAGSVLLDRPVLGGVLAAVMLVLAVLLGRSRARHLGHALTDTDLITQSGSIALSTVVLERDATVAVSVRRSFFQRRAGLATVEVATAAGKQSYQVLDVGEAEAFDLAGDLLPR